MKSIQDILELACYSNETEVNIAVFDWIKEGVLEIEVFLEYQAQTQGDIVDCLSQNETEEEE